MKQMMLVSVALTAAVGAFSLSAEVYDATTGYVTLGAGEGWTASGPFFYSYDADGIETGGRAEPIGCKWSDGLYTHSGTNYYSGRTIFANGRTSDAAALRDKFKGDKFVLSSNLQYMGAGSGYIYLGDDTTFLPGAGITWNSVGKIMGGTIYLKGTAAQPNYLRYNARTDSDSYTPSFKAKLITDATGWVDAYIYGADATCRETSALNDDYTDFLGTLRFYNPKGHVDTAFLRLQVTHAFNFAGTFEVTGPHLLEISGNGSTTPQIGTFKLGDGVRLSYTTSGNAICVNVTNKLVLGQNVQISPYIAGGSSWSTKGMAEVTRAIFRLSPEAVANGLPSFDGVTIAGDAQIPTGLLAPELLTAERPDGGVEFCVHYNEIVAFTNNESLGQTPFKWKEGAGENHNPIHHLSDGLPFHEGVDYVASGKNLILQIPDGTSGPLIFPGHSFISIGGAMGMYVDTTFNDLALGSGGRFRQMNANGYTSLTSGWKYPIRGRINMYNSSGFKFNAGDNSTYQIYSDIRGAGPINIGMDTEMASSGLNVAGLRNFRGAMELLGDNSAYTGKISVYSGQRGDFNTWFSPFAEQGFGPYEPSAVSNITLIVHGKNTLGGALPAFTYDALKICDHSRLTFAETATFDTANRGICFLTNAYLKAEADVVATVNETITWGNGTTVKEGAGAILFGAAPKFWDGEAKTSSEEYNGAELRVDAGRIGQSGAGALAGIRVTLGKGAGLVAVPGGAPFELTGDFESVDDMDEGLPLDVAVDLAGLEDYALEYTVPLLKYGETSPWSLKLPTVSLAHAPKGYRLGEMTTSSDGAGNITLSVRVWRQPAAFIVK